MDFFVYGVTLLLWLGTTSAQSPYVPSTQSPYTTCSYGRSSFSNGQTVTTLPECCLSLVCDNGYIRPRHFGPPGSSGCCEFDGKMYPDGTQLSSYCVPLVCRAGNWTRTHKIEECCKLCKVYNDPHFSTFDGYNYHWHGLCNYTITQTGRSHYPNTAIFSNFHRCFGTSNDASCLQKSLFKNDQHTILTLDHTAPSMFSLLVNGHPFTVPATGVHLVHSTMTHPVLAWRDGSCTFLAGSSRILIRHCQNQLSVWAYPTLANQLYGLCGHFNFYQNDDMTNRDGTVHPLHQWPKAFPESWKTELQSSGQCLTPCTYCPESTNDPCRASPHAMRSLKAKCAGHIHEILGRNANLIYHVDSCAWDLCIAQQTGLSLLQQHLWLKQVFQIVRDSKIMDFRTHGTWQEQNPPTTGVCTKGSRWKRNCFWCTCTHDANADCAETICQSDYEHPTGTDACVDGSWWKVDECNWCRCVTGGHICSYNNCTAEQTVTLVTAPPSEQVCFYSVATGSCQNYETRFYYNYLNGKCERFVYTGCGGNANNFRTATECETTCGHLTTLATSTTTTTTSSSRPPQCNLQPNSGPCKETRLRYYYNATTETCEPFAFGGCLGNANNFVSKISCEGFCGPTKPDPTNFPSTYVPPTFPPRCSLPPTYGSCTHTLTRYYYNPISRSCLAFTYSGCNGNENNFPTKENCEITCLIRTDQTTTPTHRPVYNSSITYPPHCSLHADPGTCHNHTIRYYYNKVTGTCQAFMYGGCGGNNNNFMSEEWCLASCSLPATGSPTETSASLPANCYKNFDVGKCYDALWRWYYNAAKQSCQVFVYGGCGGNDNNFLSKEDCQTACRVQTQSTTATTTTTNRRLPCYQPKERGPCSKSEKHYYFDLSTKTCQEFDYSGCGGNQNNFRSLLECLTTCIF